MAMLDMHYVFVLHFLSLSRTLSMVVLGIDHQPQHRSVQSRVAQTLHEISIEWWRHYIYSLPHQI
ncbi:hypothetical protein BDA96_04G142400 [Sorghum bicolor]|uniref:Secreted protein n=1 Tax=Sorghum bicolor TaxID=4558 RepID=A0A921R5A7_SORBI|nr:hypothetical protein BDA96_04G142400 [Sorghum bicolor]